MKKTLRIFNKTIILLTFLLTMIAFIGSIYTINKNALYMKSELGGYRASALTMVCIALGCIMLITVFRFIFSYIDKCTAKKIKIITALCFVIFAMISAFMVINFQSIPISDSVAVEGEALAIAKGKLSVIDADINSYFARYSNNDMLVLLTALFFKICMFLGIKNTVLATVALNALLIFISEIFVYIAVRMMSGERVSCKYMVLSTLQPIMYLSIPWFYSLTVCLPFMTGSFCLGIAAYKTKSNLRRSLYGVLFSFVSVMGYFIRPIVLITAIAYVMCAAMYFIIKKNALRNLHLLCCVVLCCVVAFWLVKECCQNIAKLRIMTIYSL